MSPAVLALTLLLGGPASAATWITPDQTMTRTGACGSGGAVVGDGCAPVRYAGQPQIAASGQDLEGGWNSQDTDAARLTFAGAGALAVRLTLRDFHDQARSHGRIVAWNGASWDFERGANANEHIILLTMPDGDPIGYVDFSTRWNDGFTARVDVCLPEG